MLFDQNIEPGCSYCRHSKALGRDEFACSKQGIMFGSGQCGSFRYEPTKRIPPELPSVNPSTIVDIMSDEEFDL